MVKCVEMGLPVALAFQVGQNVEISLDTPGFDVRLHPAFAMTDGTTSQVAMAKSYTIRPTDPPLVIIPLRPVIGQVLEVLEGPEATFEWRPRKEKSRSDEPG